MTGPEVQLQHLSIESAEKPLAGKVFLLTGASRGIGAVTALELVRKGAIVIGPHRDPGKELRAQEVVEQAGGIGGEMVALVSDVTKAEDRADLLNFVKQKYGKIDGIILNHAGGLEKDCSENYSLEVNGHSKLALFNEAQKAGILQDQALVIDIPSLWSKFYYSGIKQMDVYEPVAKGKKLGEKLLREVIRSYNNQTEDGCHVKLGSVCGQGVAGTITMRMLERLYKDDVAEIKKSAEGGKLPDIIEMARAVANMAEGKFRDEEVTYVGVPQITEAQMPDELPMYSSDTRYINSLLIFDPSRSFGFYRIQNKDTRTHFRLEDSYINTDTGNGEVCVDTYHTIGHFVPEFGLSIFPGHKIVAAAVDIATLKLEDLSDEFIIPTLKRIEGIEFKVPVLPGDKLLFTQTDNDFSVRIGKTEVAAITGLELGPRNLENPRNMTPDRLIEAGALTLGTSYIRSKGLNNILPLFSTVGGPVEYYREVFPGEVLEMEAVLTGEGDKEFQGDVVFRVDDEIVAKAFGYACQLRAQRSIERGIRMGRRILG